MVLRGRPTLTRFPTNSRYTPVDNTPLHSIARMSYPWGILLSLWFIVVNFSKCPTRFLTLICDEAPRDIGEVARAFN